MRVERMDHLSLTEIAHADQFAGAPAEMSGERPPDAAAVEVERRVAVDLGLRAGGQSRRTSRVRSVPRLEPIHMPVPSGVTTIG